MEILTILVVVICEALLYIMGILLSLRIDREMYGQWTAVPLVFVNSLALIYILLIM